MKSLYKDTTLKVFTMQSTHITSLVFLIWTLFVSAPGMPLSTTHTEMARIVMNPCGSGTPASTSDAAGNLTATVAGLGGSSDLDNVTLLDDLRIKVRETYSAAATLTDEVYSRWTEYLTSRPIALNRVTQFATMRLTVTTGNDDSLTEQQNELLRLLLQASRYVLFLEEEENRSSYGPKRGSLTDLKGRLVQVTCAARQLLTVSDSELQAYVTARAQRSLRLSDGIRRNIMAVALKMIRDFLNSIDL